jgi:ubiquinone/menaquinone biosynthesis C-methylase UbiE
MKDQAVHIGGNPTGLKGIFAGYVMNIVHSRLYSRAIKHIHHELLQNVQAVSILDLGCGGGKAIQLFCKHIADCNVCGIDHSKEMIELSTRVNRKYIEQKRVKLIQCDVANLPFASSHYDMVSAFDTFNLWENLDGSIKEVARVLKEDGLFLIINGYPKEGTKWWDIVRFKSDKEYSAFLEARGFVMTKIEISNNTIIMVCKKKCQKENLETNTEKSNGI